MKFIRNPKPVTAQRSRARHLAHKRKGKPAPPRDELITAGQLVAALTGLSPIAMRDYIEWLRSQPATREEKP
jgi:hypothetical protein